MRSELERLSLDWADVKEIIIYGTGGCFRETAEWLFEDYSIPFLIDNDKHKAHTSCHGVEIIPFAEAKHLIGGKKIVVAAASVMLYREIAAELEASGLREYRDYAKLEDFLVEWNLRFRNRVVITHLHQALTLRCSLRCRKCSMFAPYHKAVEDFPLDQLKKDMELVFSKIDRVYSLRLLGGEPLLHRQLGEYIDYIQMNYGERINYFTIFTNGTVIPPEDTLELLRRHHVYLKVSDYTDVVPYGKKLEEFVAKLEEKGIAYERNREMEWRDPGFPDHPLSYADPASHMRDCGMICHSVQDGKYYHCQLSWSAEKCGLIHLAPDEFVDLSRSDVTGEQIAMQSLGIFEKGYLGMCRVCGGLSSYNDRIIRAGEQLC